MNLNELYLTALAFVNERRTHCGSGSIRSGRQGWGQMVVPSSDAWLLDGNI